MEETLQALKADLKAKKIVLMCGAGVGMAISEDLRSWEGFVDQFFEKVAEIMALNATFAAEYRAITGPNFSERINAKINHIVRRLNLTWNPRAMTPSERHRMIAQLILRNPTLNEESRRRARILHELEALILTTNYDTAIEDCLPKERLSISHIEAGEYIGMNCFTDNETLAPGPFFQDPLKRFVIHIHGRYFDVGMEHGFCFTPEEYNHSGLLARFIVFMDAIVTSKSLLFIGASGTLDDDHFMRLWQYVGRRSKKHYILHRRDDMGDIVGKINTILQNTGVEIIPICFGENYDDLWGFLQRLREN